MKNLVSLILYSVLVFLLHESVSLRCRSGNQQVDAQFQKVLKMCKNRYVGNNMNNSEESTSTEDSNSGSDSSSEDNVYDKNFYYKKGDKSLTNQTMHNQRYRNSDMSNDMNTYSSDRTTNGNLKDNPNIKYTRKINGRDSWNSGDSHNRTNDFYNEDTSNDGMRFNNNTDQEQACIVQCFFDELNAVDQKGFPEKDLVIPLMNYNIHDPDLKDFVEESIIECFHYLESNKKDKCEFSQNLLTCLAEKGKQNCEDWEN
ncbi:General odorant-binding protein 71 [Anthophora plagiata]